MSEYSCKINFICYIISSNFMTKNKKLSFNIGVVLFSRHGNTDKGGVVFYYNGNT